MTFSKFGLLTGEIVTFRKFLIIFGGFPRRFQKRQVGFFWNIFYLVELEIPLLLTYKKVCVTRPVFEIKNILYKKKWDFPRVLAGLARMNSVIGLGSILRLKYGVPGGVYTPRLCTETVYRHSDQS